MDLIKGMKYRSPIPAVFHEVRNALLAVPEIEAHSPVFAFRVKASTIFDPKRIGKQTAAFNPYQSEYDLVMFVRKVAASNSGSSQDSYNEYRPVLTCDIQLVGAAHDTSRYSGNLSSELEQREKQEIAAEYGVDYIVVPLEPSQPVDFGQEDMARLIERANRQWPTVDSDAARNAVRLAVNGKHDMLLHAVLAATREAPLNVIFEPSMAAFLDLDEETVTQVVEENWFATAKYKGKSDLARFLLKQANCDLLVCSPAPYALPMLVLESDGKQHREDRDNILKDKAKDALLSSCGIQVVRIDIPSNDRNSRAPKIESFVAEECVAWAMDKTSDDDYLTAVRSHIEKKLEEISGVHRFASLDLRSLVEQLSRQVAHGKNCIGQLSRELGEQNKRMRELEAEREYWTNEAMRQYPEEPNCIYEMMYESWVEQELEEPTSAVNFLKAADIEVRVSWETDSLGEVAFPSVVPSVEGVTMPPFLPCRLRYLKATSRGLELRIRNSVLRSVKDRTADFLFKECRDLVRAHGLRLLERKRASASQ